LPACIQKISYFHKIFFYVKDGIVCPWKGSVFRGITWKCSVALI